MFIFPYFFTGLWGTTLTENTSENRELYVKTTLRELLVYIVFLVDICLCELCVVAALECWYQFFLLSTVLLVILFKTLLFHRFLSSHGIIFFSKNKLFDILLLTGITAKGNCKFIIFLSTLHPQKKSMVSHILNGPRKLHGNKLKLTKLSMLPNESTRFVNDLIMHVVWTQPVISLIV